MDMSWLAHADFATNWAHSTWTDFRDQPERAQMAVLPIYGLADHGLGQSLDSEEILGGALLRNALDRTRLPVLTLPPLRGGLAPYPSGFFGLEVETFHDQLHEIAAGVRAAGLRRLAFWVTGPWNEAPVEAAARDLRVELGLATYVVRLSGLGIDLHPAAPSRTRAQAIVATLTGRAAKKPSRAGEARDTDFRPGRWREPSRVTPEPGLDGRVLLDRAGARLGGLLAEILRHESPVAPASPATSPPPDQATSTPPPEPPAIWPGAWRHRYLGALTRDELDALPDKKHALVILPIGAIEQHGPHLPVGVDSLLAQAWLDHALPRLPAPAPVWVAPPLWYGQSQEHREFPGTLSLATRTLRRLVLTAARQLHALGFRHLAILNTHGGNSAVLVYTLREIQETLDMRAGMIRPGGEVNLNPREATAGFHAGQWETALMLAVAPATVRMERAGTCYPPADPAGELRPVNAPATHAWLARDLSPDGVIGDATLATAADGQAWLEAGCNDLVTRLTALVNSTR